MLREHPPQIEAVRIGDAAPRSRGDPDDGDVEVRETRVGRAVHQDLRQPAADVAEAEEEELHVPSCSVPMFTQKRAWPAADHAWSLVKAARRRRGFPELAHLSESSASF